MPDRLCWLKLFRHYSFSNTYSYLRRFLGNAEFKAEGLQITCTKVTEVREKEIRARFAVYKRRFLRKTKMYEFEARFMLSASHLIILAICVPEHVFNMLATLVALSVGASEECLPLLRILKGIDLDSVTLTAGGVTAKADEFPQELLGNLKAIRTGEMEIRRKHVMSRTPEPILALARTLISSTHV